MPLKLVILILAQTFTLPTQPRRLQGTCLPTIGRPCMPFAQVPLPNFFGFFLGGGDSEGERSTTQLHPTHMTNDEYKDSPFPPNIDAIREFLFVFRIRIGSLERKIGSSSSSSSREVGAGAGAGARARHRWMRSIPFFSFYLWFVRRKTEDW